MGEEESSLRLGERGPGSLENLGCTPNTHSKLESKFSRN